MAVRGPGSAPPQRAVSAVGWLGLSQLSDAAVCDGVYGRHTQQEQTKVTRTQRIVDARTAQGLTVHELPDRIRRAQQSPYASCERSPHVSEVVLIHR